MNVDKMLYWKLNLYNYGKFFDLNKIDMHHWSCNEWYTYLNYGLAYSSEKLMCTLNLDMFVLNGTEGGFKGVHYYYYRFILFTKNCGL